MQETSPETVGFRLSPQQAQPLARGRGNAVQCALAPAAELDQATLQSRLEAIVARLEVLRTRLMALPGMLGAQQVIAEQLSPVCTRRQDGSLDAALADEAAGIDAENGPVLRACLLERPGDEAPALMLSAAAGVADEESLLALLAELTGAGGTGDEPLQYADYAEWRHELLTGDEPADAQGRAFWIERMEDLPEPLPLLFGAARPSEQGTVASEPVRLQAVSADAVLAAAREAGASPGELLEVAWHALILRLTGAEELLVAGRVNGRGQDDLAGAIGPYAQRGAIRTHAGPDTTCAELLDQVRRERVAAVRWQDYATAEQLTALTRSGTGFAFHDNSIVDGELLVLRGAHEQMTLAISLRAQAGVLVGELRYDAGAFDQSDAGELVQRYEHVLAAVVADLQAALVALPLSDAVERERLLAMARSPEATPATDVPVHRLVARVAARSPERAAVAGTDGVLSYGELDRAANRLAHHLNELNGGSRAPIAICLDRTPQMIVALLAILKSGAPYLPLNPEHPAARLEHQLGESGARVIVSEAALADRLPAAEKAVVRIDSDRDAIAGRADTAPEVATDPEQLAYVMYTSGSTGAPKGVKVTHGNLAAYALGILERLGIEEDPELRFGLVSAISTDLGNTAIFPTLVSGGCVQVFSEAAVTDAASLAAELGGARLDALKITPSHLRALLAGDTPSAVLPQRWLLVGGEALSWELAERVRVLVPECRLVNHYGPTEATIGCCAHAVEAATRDDAVTVPIGTPLPGAIAYVLDARLEPLPDGVPGELCIAGTGVAAGYADGRPENEARFATGPAGERIYRTGDRVRRLRDGAIEFLGRLDEQVKIRGFRVELGEIEAALREHPAVAQAAVAAQDDGRDALELVAYLVTATAPSVEELRTFLADRLPDYMIPVSFATLPALPLTPSGKVDRRALAAAADGMAERGSEYVAPRDELEAEIAAIWQELLGVERVGVTDDFFALGGHSLLATQAIMRIRRSHGDVPLRALLAAPTVATLAEAVRAASTKTK